MPASPGLARPALKEAPGGNDDEFTRAAMTAAPRKLRIAQVAPPLERVPPVAYGGTERIVHGLATELAARGHEITVFASGDSDVPGTLVPTVDKALRPAGIEGDASGWFLATVQAVLERASEFDIIHSHLEWWSIPLARMTPVPMVSTFHGRLDLPWSERLFEDAPEGLVAISRSQASAHPKVPWTIIHNGLVLDQAPFKTDRSDAFCFVGRVDPEKGIVEAMDIAALTSRPLRLAAKVGNLPEQRAYYENVFRPALKRASRNVEFLGELSPEDRDQLFAESYGTLMPGAWPEPFGLVSIESLACGTPILARRVGALPEVIREGVDGFFGDDAMGMAFHADALETLDRRAIRERVIERFSAARMTDRYEELYARMIGHVGRSPKPSGAGFTIAPAPGRPGQLDRQPGPFGAQQGVSSLRPQAQPSRPASPSPANPSADDATDNDAGVPRSVRSPAATGRS
jgi:glycosyltransferase involved in cell wall biosynthesis